MSIPFFTPFGKENAYFPRPGKSYPGKDVWPMETTPQKYQQYVRQKQKKSPLAKDLTLVFLSALLTGLNLYHRIARYGGAGTLVPITGFANAVVSPAIDFRAEGFVTGMAAKMFLVAGPVIVFGTVASALYGLILWLVG